jgi:tRNA uridine 5-carbamoylmethylation protein Kti12
MCSLQDLWKRFEAPNDANRWDNPLFKVKNTAAEHATSPTEAAPPTDIAVETVIQPKSLKSSWKPKKKKATDGSDAAAEATTVDAAPSSSSAAAFSSASTADDASSTSRNTLSISGTKVTDGDDLSQFVELATVFPALTDYLLHANLPLPNSSTVAAAHAQADLLYELDRTSQRITQMIMAHQADALEGTPLKFTDYDRVLTLNRLISPGELQRYRSQFVKVHSQHPPTTSVAVGVSFIEFLGLHL